MSQPSGGVRVKLWDGPVRIVHWLLVVLIAFSWWSSGDHMDWHRWSGYAIIGLVLFRIYWGFAGSGAARFASFVRGPKAVAAYVATLGKRETSVTPGHNPLGAISVVAILGVLIVQVGTGLFAVDIDAFEAGPLSDRVSFELGRRIAGWHNLSFTALQVLVAVHVLAVLFYWVWKRTNLIGAMVTGHRTLPSDPGLAGAPAWRLLVGVVIAAAIAWLLSKGLRV